MVFLFLAALYESWSVPFSVLLAVPLGAFGAIIALTLLPKLSNNVYAQIGLITLIGLAAKNAILIVEFAKERVDHGMELHEAIIDAVKIRLRPDHYDFIGLYSGRIAAGILRRGWCHSPADHRLDG
jgi:HAE1 family hydrophobic/amphiphilic exporter-1